jgi:hypothetical protein
MLWAVNIVLILSIHDGFVITDLSDEVKSLDLLL